MNPKRTEKPTVKKTRKKPVGVKKRKRTEAALQRNEQVLRLFVEHSPAAIAMFDQEMRYIVASRRYLADYRLPEQHDLTGRSHYDVFPEMDEPRREIHRRCLAGEVVKCEEDPLPRFDGTLDYVRYELRPWYEANGSIGGLIFFSEVITERKRVEDQVMQMKRLYATLSQVNQTIVRVKTQAELYQSICDLAVKFGEFSLAWVGLLDEETGDVRPVFANGLDLQNWPFETINIHKGPLKDALSATAIRTNKVVISRDVQTDSRVKSASDQIGKHAYHSSAAVPFRLRGKTIGALLLVSTRVGLFDQKEEVLLLEEMALDISFALDTMRAEKVMHQWADAFEHSGHGMVIGDPRTNRILTCNPAFAREQGSTVEALISMPLKDLYTPQDQERIGKLIAQADRDGYVQFEANKVRADGSIYPVQMDLVSVRDEGGELLYRVATQQDITARKHAEDELVRTRSTLTEAQKIGNLGSFEYIFATQTTTWSEEEYHIYGLDPSEPSPSYEVMLQKCIHPDDATLLHETFTRAIQSRSTYELEHRILQPDGSVRWVYDRAHPYFDEQGELVRYIGATLDITERKQAEELVLANKAKLDIALDSMTDAVFISDLDGNFLEFNDAFATFHKFKNKAECSRTFAEYPAFLEVFMADGIPAPVEKWAVPRALRGEVGTNVEYGLRRKDTGESWVGSYSFAPIRDGSGTITGSVVVARDTSELKSVERESRQRMEDLLLVNVLNDAVNRGEDLPGITATFAQETRKVFHCQDVAIYLLSPDGKYVEMQTSTLSPKLAGRIERLIGRPIPKVRVPLREDGYFRKLLSDQAGTITSDPKLIQQWIGEFSDTTFLPTVFRPIVNKLTPQIYKLLNIRSTITIPLVSHGHTLGMLDMSSKGMFTEEDLKRIHNISHQITAVILRKQAELQLQVQLQRMSALGEIDRAISSTQDMQVSLDILLREGLPQLAVDAASILLLNPASQALEYFSGRGFRTLAIRDAYITLGEGLAGRVGSERKMIHVSDLSEVGDQFRRAGLLKEEGFTEYFGVPLIAKGTLKGVMEVFHRGPLNPDAEWVNYLETLGRQAAIAIDNAQLLEGMQRSNQELIAAYDATIAGWSRAMDLRDKETEGHTQRVTEVAVQLAKRMDVNQYDIVQLRRGALLHDIGKLGVPDHILLKPDKLTEIEWAMMRQHPTYAFNMLLSISYLRPALDIPYCHHEKWNGEGYPRGLKEEQIPLSARIFAIVDVWDALRSNRPYRKGWPEEQVIEYLREQSGKQFDPRVVKEFLKMHEEDSILK